jgi:hypothetical protein
MKPIIEEEIWKDIPGYERLYQASNLGRIKSLAKMSKNRGGVYLRKENFLKPTINNKGYCIVKLYKNEGKIKNTIFVHKLISITFISNPKNYLEINHIDGVKTNNCVQNLEWCSRSHNVKETYRLNLKKAETYKGEGNPTSKLKERDVLLIRTLHKEGISNKNLATKFNVVVGTIGFIINNQTWKHI